MEYRPLSKIEILSPGMKMKGSNPGIEFQREKAGIGIWLGLLIPIRLHSVHDIVITE
jgi:hypothetical protein